MNPSEYDVTYAVKEWLLKNGWKIIAFDPPGAQGTFSIPNPTKKEEGYKGQTGTQSPDIIAIKNDYLIIVESKDCGDSKIKKDVIKIKKFLKNKARMDIFEKFVSHACKSNEIELNFDKSKIILAKAHGGKNLLLQKDIETFQVTIAKEWDSTMINPKIDLSEIIVVEYHPTSKERKAILEN